jgi:hypothetical protein
VLPFAAASERIPAEGSEAASHVTMLLQDFANASWLDAEGLRDVLWAFTKETVPFPHFDSIIENKQTAMHEAVFGNQTYAHHRDGPGNTLGSLAACEVAAASRSSEW